jgi:hypothetical protein
VFLKWPTVLAGAALMTLGLSQPAGARSAPDPPPDLAIFEVRASHGYDVTIIASRSPDGEGTIAVLAANRRSAAIYRTTATVTATAVEADLGELGRISVRSVRTGRERTVRDGCEGQGKRRIGATRYEGTIEFHGEEGFTDVSASGAPFAFGTYLAFACAVVGGRPPGKQLPGAFLDVHRNPEENELMLHAIQSRPGAATSISVQIDIRRGDFEITRATGVRGRAGTLRFDPQLRSATLAPPAPFAGHATFHRDASPAGRWTGNLTVDLPGDSDYPLTGPGLEVNLVHPTA